MAHNLGRAVGVAHGSSRLTRPTVAVVPFGARGPEPRAGALARQIARRIVERLADETAVELRPVFLVSVPEESDREGYLVIGSTPDPALAAGYGASLGCSHALVGTLLHGAKCALDLSLVEVGTRTIVGSATLSIAPGELQLVEPAVQAWLGEALGLDLAAGDAPAAATEAAYAALLLGMESELNAVLLASGSTDAAAAAKLEALGHYAACIREDPSSDAAEQRLLVMSAESLGSGLEEAHIDALETLSEARTTSWKAHYLLGELRRTTGDSAGAVVALEHADALHPLGTADSIRLAELYTESGAEHPAAARLRRVRRALGDDAPPDLRLLLAHALIRSGRGEDALIELERVIAMAPAGAESTKARRLRLGLLHPELESTLAEAGRQAVEGPAGSLGDAVAGFERVLGADPDLWEAVFGLGLAARRTGDPAAAERAFRRTLELWPGHPDAMHELGVALLTAGSFDDAVRTLEEAAALRPDDAGYIADAGFAQLRAGRLPEARERLDRAARLAPADPITRAYRSELERVEAGIGRGS